MGVGVLLQVMVVYIPVLQTIFKTVALGTGEWLVIFAGAMLLMAVIEGTKFVYVRR